MQAPSPVNPNALDRTAAWLLNMNVQFLEEENAEPECKLRSKDELSQEEKVTEKPRRFFLQSSWPWEDGETLGHKALN